MTIFTWLIVICWIAFLLYWFASSLGAKRNVGNSWLQGIGVRALLFIVVAALLQTNLFRSTDASAAASINPVLGTFGVIICALGVALAIWARKYLGKNWGMPMSVKENPELVTTGPYSYIRHPIYSGIFLALIGTALATSPVLLIIFAVYLVYFIYSARAEEKLMAATFPADYPSYKKRTKMLIPFIF